MSVVTVTLPKDLPSETLKEVMELVPYLSEHITSVTLHRPRELLIHLNDTGPLDVAALSTDAIDLVEKLDTALSKDIQETLYASEHVPLFQGNPWGHLVESGMIRAVAPGLCYLSGDCYELVEHVDSLLRNHATTLGAVLESYASILPITSMATNGYLSNFPQHAFFVSSAHQSLKSLRSISRLRADQALLPPTLASAAHVLAPTVCYHCFEGLRGATIPGTAVFSARGMCHRQEFKKADTLLRLAAFNMREVVFFGDAAYVGSIRSELLEYTMALMDALKVQYRVVTASDPFFTTGAEQRRVFQKLTRAKLELQLRVPYCDTWVAVASFNQHADTLTKKYAMAPVGLCSGCVGVGHERLLYCLISQLGCDLRQIIGILESLQLSKEAQHEA